MTLEEINEKRELIKSKMLEMINSAQAEYRKLSEQENFNFETLKKELSELDEEERKLNENNKENNTETKMEKRKFNLLKAVADIANGRQLDESALEVNALGQEQMRHAGQNWSGQLVIPVEDETRSFDGIITTNDYVNNTYNGGGENVAEVKGSILEPIRNRMVLGAAGATYINANSDLSIPVYGGSSCGWKGEVANADNGTGKWSEVKYSPMRLTSKVFVSKEFLAQDTNSAEQMLKNDILNSIAEKLEATILGSESGVTGTRPAGIFAGESANASAVTFADIVALEEGLDGKNMSGKLAYIVSPTAKSALRTTQKGNGTGFIMENGEIEGLPVYCTSAVYNSGAQTPAAWKGVALADWSDLLIVQFGAIDLTVDPYTKAADGQVVLVVNAYFDAKFRRDDSHVVDVLH